MIPYGGIPTSFPPTMQKMLLLKLSGALGGVPIEQLLGRGKQWSDRPLSPQLRLPTLYGISPMGGASIYEES